MRYRIAHIGSFNRNLGDNIALYNIQKEFNRQLNGIDWVLFDIMDIFWKRNNNIEFVKNLFSHNKFDAIVVGGGGLIEYEGYGHHDTGYKLPFNKEIIESLGCPVFFMGLGINYFRGKEGFSDKAKKSLKETAEGAAYFSLRNDGSLKIFKDLLNIETNEIPDPGLIYSYEKRDNYYSKYNVIQPAFNSSEGINQNRFLGKQNIDNLVEYTKNSDMIVMPHTPKDFRYFSNYILDVDSLKDMLKFDYTDELVKVYLKFDSIIALRGHGQLISIGLNIPGLYLSTQDKVRDFSYQNGFENYNIDIKDENWLNTLESKFIRLQSDEKYRAEWYIIRKKQIDKWNEQLNHSVNECINILTK